jgi:Antitoxin Xre/MbcA/ParS C-terminal toxin-binding domain
MQAGWTSPRGSDPRRLPTPVCRKRSCRARCPAYSRGVAAAKSDLTVLHPCCMEHTVPRVTACADLWGLTEEQRLLILGYPSRSTYHNWCKQAREHGAFTLDVDVLTRISAVLGIHQGLGILFPTEQLGIEWLRTPHNAVIFGGRPPLDLVTSGSQDGLLSVRRFLDGARGGLYMQPNAIDEAFTPYDDVEIVFR